jgi:putative tryptophan/tyrosine transport system substrate-binding protein
MQFDQLKRREFIALLGGAAAWPRGTQAQQPKLPIIGILATGPRATWDSWTDAFVERLRGLGWIDRRTVAFAYRWAEGRPGEIH